YADQRDMYASLINDDDVTHEELSTYFHSMQFGPEGEIESSYDPRDGVTVYRDSFGIPHVYADTLVDASFALGYVTAEDRLWESDVFRHAARGTLSEFVGPSFLEMDIATRREGYTEEEVQKIFDDFDDEFGVIGTRVQEGLQAYADGFNAYVDELKTDPSRCPAEYQALGNPCPEPHPEEWTPTDTLFIAILQLRIFGETAGDELQNAGLYAHLREKLGAKIGPKVFEDLLRRNDPRSPTSLPRADGRFPSQDLGRTKAPSVAIPEDAVTLAQETLAAERAREQMLETFGFKAPASNALLVSARESETGNPLQIGAPQVGYATPSFFLDIDVHVPAEGVHFRGPAVPGTSALIPLGRGADYAWSLTTGYSDAVDTRAELLCDPAGGEATQDSNGYMFKGECREMESRDETFVIKPSAGSVGPPGAETHTFYRTVHGPVFARGVVDGKPVAFVKERFFWMRELDSIPQFYRWNTRVQSVADFRAAASKFTMSFNSFYADHKDIGYFHVGFYPRRARGVHPALPVWGTGEWEWRGRIPFKLHPQAVNPSQGWLANWNNKPAVGWDNYDGIKWGPIQRVALLQRQMRALTAGPRKAELSDLVDVIRVAATQDARAVFLGPKMLRTVSRTLEPGSRQAEALDLVTEWVTLGAHHHNRNYDGDMDEDGDPDNDMNEDNGPAAVIFDNWYETLVHLIFDDELGEVGFDLLPTPISDRDQWHDMSSYISNLLNRRARDAYARNYCDDMTTTDTKETCDALIVKAFNQAVDFLTRDQGEDIAAWTTRAWFNTFQKLGLGSVRQMPWQNRGTHNHVVEILRKVNDGPTGGGGGASPRPSPTET
ncbi:MAG: penicillin acylase family protein, partial [Actinomycetota bacterium]|nr:penicillin acylase family protein [Actinomycetota bacterium]